MVPSRPPRAPARPDLGAGARVGALVDEADLDELRALDYPDAGLVVLGAGVEGDAPTRERPPLDQIDRPRADRQLGADFERALGVLQDERAGWKDLHRRVVLQAKGHVRDGSERAREEALALRRSDVAIPHHHAGQGPAGDAEFQARPALHQAASLMNHPTAGGVVRPEPDRIAPGLDRETPTSLYSIRAIRDGRGRRRRPNEERRARRRDVLSLVRRSVRQTENGRHVLRRRRRIEILRGHIRKP